LPPSARARRFAASGQIKELRIPRPWGGPIAVASGSDGARWFTNVANQGIGRLSHGAFSFFSLPHPSVPYDIVAGPDGALWATAGNRIARITTAGHVSDFALPPCANCGTYDAAEAIVAGSDGNLYYTRPSESVIGQVTPTGRIKEFPVGGVESSPTWMTSGPDGALWFTDSTGIGRMTLQGSVSQAWSGLVVGRLLQPQ
jgi:virginiamycin B lyase